MCVQSMIPQTCISPWGMWYTEPCATCVCKATGREEREVSLTVPRCHRCSSAAAASRSCSTVRVSARGLEELKEGPPRSRGAQGARQEATLASNSNKRRWIARCMAMWRG